MKIHRIASIAISLVLSFVVPIQVSADLNVLPPERMLGEATIIVTGEVTKIEEGSNNSEENVGTIQVDKILKGNLDTSILTLKEYHYINNALLQGIPPVGTKVFVLLKGDGDDKPYFFADCNHIGIIKDGSIVEIYKGTNVKIHPYVEYYNKYYKGHKANAKVLNNVITEDKSVKDNIELTTVKENSKALTDIINAYVFVLIFLGLTIIIILFILVSRKQKR